MTKRIYKIQGMDCPSCAMLIESELEDNGIKAKVSFAKCELCFNSGVADERKIKEVVEKAGYKLKE